MPLGVQELDLISDDSDEDPLPPCSTMVTFEDFTEIHDLLMFVSC